MRVKVKYALLVVGSLLACLLLLNLRDRAYDFLTGAALHFAIVLGLAYRYRARQSARPPHPPAAPPSPATVKSVLFFSNGNTAVFDRAGGQVPELQLPWIISFAHFLLSAGVDPASLDITMPGGKPCNMIRVGDGYSWRFSKDGK